MKSKRFTNLIAIFVMSLLACVALIGATVVSADEQTEITPNASAEVAKYFETTDGVTFGIDGNYIYFNVTKDAKVVSVNEFNLNAEIKVVNSLSGLTVTTNTGVDKGFGKLIIEFDVENDESTSITYPYVIEPITVNDKALYSIENGEIKADLSATTFKKPFAGSVIYGYKYEDVTVEAYHGFAKIDKTLKFYDYVPAENVTVDESKVIENFDVDNAKKSGDDYKFTSKGTHYVIYGFKDEEVTALEYQTVEIVTDVENVKAPIYDADKLQEFVTGEGYVNYVESFEEQLIEDEKWVAIGSSTPFEFEKDNELYNYFASEVFVNADLEPVIYYKLPESDSFTKLSSSSSTKKFYLTKVGYYEFYVLATDPLNNSLEIDEEWEFTTVNVKVGEENRAVKGYFNDANADKVYTIDELQVPVFTFYLGNSGPQIKDSGSSNSTTAGFINVKYSKLSTFTVLGVDTTTTYKLFYNANVDATNPENGGDGWKEISDEEVFKTVFADKEYTALGWSSSSLDFVPVEKGAYIVKCEVVDGDANEVSAYSAIVKVESGITKAEVARVQVWFENNWKSLIFLGIALLSLIGIIVLLFVKPKEEKELEENTTAR